jgi:Domain of unknown function (DUF6438)
MAVFRLGAVMLAVLLSASCARRAPALRAPYADVPRSTITAIELRTTPCYGTCPAFTLRLTADGVARYEGREYAPRVGSFTSRVDFERIAAWIDSQQPETLAAEYASGYVDTPVTTLVVERGKSKTTVTTRMMSDSPVRLEGIVLALDGLSDRLRWRAIDDLTPFVGDFANGAAVIHVMYRNADLDVYGADAIRCPKDRYPGTSRWAGRVHVVCGPHESWLTAAPGGLRAEGDAMTPGFYERITTREADRRSGIVPNPQAR